jgi:hypothetical protein|tara:strand:+ start:241 stop:642 length:402 start_codon:yes stop_codon:yes gene_type:complete
MSENIEIFEGKTFQELTKDIYENCTSKKLQLDLLIQEIHGFITSIDDAILIAPIIKEVYEVAVKNDEHLVKLSSVLQRIITRSAGGGDEDSLALTEQEKEDLIDTLQETADEIQKQSDEFYKVKKRSNPVLEN